MGTVAVRDNGGISFELSDHLAVKDARAELRAWLAEQGRLDIAQEAELVLSELATNALLHGGEWARVSVRVIDEGVRIAVEDRARTGPVLGWASESSMTGRGLALVRALAADYGVEATDTGKAVWAEIRSAAHVAIPHRAFATFDAGDVLVADEVRYRVTLGDVPTALLLDAKSHVDNLVREFTLAAAGARTGSTKPIPTPLAELIESVVHRFAEARKAIKRQALDAAHAGRTHTRLELELPASAADAADDYLAALDEADSYCRAMRLLTLETPPQHKVFREWYIGELTAQLRAAANGDEPPPPHPFEERLLAEIDRVAEARRMSERSARLVTLASALAGAATPSDVARAVLTEGVAALGASGGGLLLSDDTDRLEVSATIGYDAELVERLRNEPIDADLPAAVALRTGQAIWIESVQERDTRFPALVGLERDTISMCAVPLIVGTRTLGSLRFSFSEPRLFDPDERRFVLALAAQSAQALDRAELQHDKDEISRRLQRSLLPPSLPAVPGLDVAAAYHPLGRGVQVGGDFYDMWQVGAACWAVVIGDVSGTGPEAAAMSAQVRHTLHGLMMVDRDPTSVLTQLNDAMRYSSSNGIDNLFCTAILGRIDVGEPTEPIRVRLGSGGHPGPLLRRADGSVSELYLDGTLLGVLDTVDVTVADVFLHPGDSLVLFTDGLLEARNDPEFFEVERAVSAVERADGDAAAIVSALERAVLEHTHGQLSDDVAILAIHAKRRD